MWKKITNRRKNRRIARLPVPASCLMCLHRSPCWLKDYPGCAPCSRSGFDLYTRREPRRMSSNQEPEESSKDKTLAIDMGYVDPGSRWSDPEIPASSSSPIMPSAWQFCRWMRRKSEKSRRTGFDSCFSSKNEVVWEFYFLLDAQSLILKNYNNKLINIISLLYDGKYISFNI